jgi:hypothetical protein
MVANLKWAMECLAHISFSLVCFGLYNTVAYWAPEIVEVAKELIIRLMF